MRAYSRNNRLTKDNKFILKELNLTKLVYIIMNNYQAKNFGLS